MNRTPNFFKVMLGKKSWNAQNCFAEGYIAVGFLQDNDLTPYLDYDGKKFREEIKELDRKDRSEDKEGSLKHTARTMYIFCKGVKIGDFVLSPDGDGNFAVGKVTGDYYYVEGDEQPHQRKVEWGKKRYSKDSFNENFLSSANASGTIFSLSQYSEDITDLLGDEVVDTAPSQDNHFGFQYEKELQIFLDLNWESTVLGKKYDILEDGVEFPTDTGNVDILAYNQDDKELLVIELKRGKASDDAVGQLLRYMAFIKDEIADEGETVRGCVIAKEFDDRFKRAASMVDGILYYSFEVSFKLVEQE